VAASVVAAILRPDLDGVERVSPPVPWTETAARIGFGCLAFGAA
jgi:hypothetical protein